MMTAEQFDRAQHLALRVAGIQLLQRHRELLGRRCCRLGIRDPASLDVLLQGVDRGDSPAVGRFIGLLTTKFTGFFRHPAHFAAAAAHAVQVVRSSGRARLWSAAVATGEEAYSLAMALIEAFGCDDPPATVLATDIDTAALAVAEQGEYGETALRTMDVNRRARFFEASAAIGRCRVAPTVRSRVQFQALNLASDAWPFAGAFDVIFCRNVLMYLEACHRYAILERLASLLAPEGRLILDPAEHLGRAAHFFTPGPDGVYRRQRGPCPSRRVMRQGGQRHTNAPCPPMKMDL